MVLERVSVSFLAESLLQVNTAVKDVPLDDRDNQGQQQQILPGFSSGGLPRPLPFHRFVYKV